tara:strand:- start:657 stop:1514 length:858 start_codon:yes stop_codon:yes gene_type:complete
MATLSSFFGSAVGGGTSSELTDPAKVPYAVNINSPLYLRHSNNANYHDGQDEFWRMTDYNNSGNSIRRLVGDNYVQDTAGVADTWHTITDVTGKAGYWCWAAGFSGHKHTNWATIPVHSSLRITIDGTATTRGADMIDYNANPASALSWCRPFWGWGNVQSSYVQNHYYQSWATDASPSGREMLPIKRSGEMSHMFGGTTPNNAGTPDVFYRQEDVFLSGRNQYETYSLPKVRFENSLKVEAKISIPHPSIAAGTNIGGAATALNQHYYSDHAYSFHYYDTPVTV